jgi:hypothetical protein
MKIMHFLRVTVALSILAGLLVSCSSTPKKTVEAPGVVFDQPIEKVQEAAIDALVVLGFDITIQEPAYVEGARPRKVGFFVGSGGETVGIWLESIAGDKTKVDVKTAKSIVGIVGQKEWDEEVTQELEKALR